MLVLICLLLGVGLYVWVRRQGAHHAKVDAIAADMVVAMTKKQAEAAYTEAANTAFKEYVQHLTRPVLSRASPRQDVMLWVFKAAAARDRIHQLDGGPHGVQCRNLIRIEIIKQMQMASRALMAQVEAETLRRKMSS